MFTKIKNFFKKLVDDILNTIIEVKLWVLLLLGGLIGYEIGGAVVKALTYGPAVIVGLVTVSSVMIIATAIVTTFIFAFGVKDIHESQKWRVVS